MPSFSQANPGPEGLYNVSVTDCAIQYWRMGLLRTYPLQEKDSIAWLKVPNGHLELGTVLTCVPRLSLDQTKLDHEHSEVDGTAMAASKQMSLALMTDFGQTVLEKHQFVLESPLIARTLSLLEKCSCFVERENQIRCLEKLLRSVVEVYASHLHTQVLELTGVEALMKFACFASQAIKGVKAERGFGKLVYPSQLPSIQTFHEPWCPSIALYEKAASCIT